eukprot:7344874-Pyramimonas_sp.AAC.1
MSPAARTRSQALGRLWRSRPGAVWRGSGPRSSWAIAEASRLLHLRAVLGAMPNTCREWSARGGAPRWTCARAPPLARLPLRAILMGRATRRSACAVFLVCFPLPPAMLWPRSIPRPGAWLFAFAVVQGCA